MIDILTNSLLKIPVPLNLNLDYCSHKCRYCFANLNSPKRKADLAGILSQLKNYKKRNDLISYYLRNKYPVNISNNIDPFSKSNYVNFNTIGEYLLDEGIPMQICTRGGTTWQEWAEKMETSIWYISVPYTDDNMRILLEPDAPSLDYRYEMTKEVIKKHNVIIGINPLHEKWCKNPLEIVEKYAEIGVDNFWVNGLHLSNKQKINLSNKDKEAIGDDILKQMNKKNEQSDEYLQMIVDLKFICEENDLTLNGVDYGLQNNNMQIWHDTYDNLLPTISRFFNWCGANKKEGDFIYFDEFFNYFAPKLPDIETNTSKFIFNKANIKDKSSYKKTKLSNLLHYYWEIQGVELGLAKNYPVFSWAKKQFTNKLDFIRDSDNNKVLLYHPKTFNVKDFTIIK